MTRQVRRASGTGRQTQKGAAFLILIFMLGVAAASVIVAAGPAANTQLAAAEKTASALATAREALMAYAASVPDSERPGDLPCPATSYANGQTATSCNTAASRIGYLPWKTLGLPDLRDGSGSPLLYAVSNGFKYNPRTGTLNSDTAGEFSVSGENAIAIIFAPGPSLPAQDRNAATFNVANFLELENANGDTTFTAALETGNFNDRLLWITPRAFFPALEMRAMRVAQERLNHYMSVTRRYPRSNRYMNDYECWTNGGRLPYPVGSANPCLPGGNGATAGQWTMAWPNWFFTNYWDYVMHYAVSPKCTTTSGAPCDGAGSFLTVDSQNNVRALLIRQGIPNGQTRPCSTVTQCLDDAENRDSDLVYVTPSAGNDRMTIISP
ncbi:MAG: hypothetical protein KIT13_01160 [Burkholderiales bacterium]|nr:hypothetical protein [Burkholderiales bacterium]MCW5604761.1 hypothetical protein [Burkholderiales bacterium]